MTMTCFSAVWWRRLRTSGLLLLLTGLFLSACEPATVQVIPTALPTITATFTPSPTRTPGINASPTLRSTQVAEATGGPSPTPLFGATRTTLPDDVITPTRSFNPNAARIEFFTSDPLSVEPGGQVSLFWSARNVDSAVIYRLDSDGNRSQVYNVAPDGNLPVQTRSSDRGALNFVLAVGEAADYSETRLTIPLECPLEWFFSPAPDDCPQNAPVETTIIDQTMERGRMLYIEDSNTIYTLFNDGQQPAWSRFENRYDPEQHASRDPNAPPEMIQPLNELGFVWRGDDTVRNRLGLGTAEAIEFQGFVQTAPATAGREIVYISGANGVVLQILPDNDRWQIIGGPR